ncbi:hypothetical protein [Natronococcus jeotgali]|uniref:Uncharacterized protein n=1 Tax=Natronococcus jeotgali DSM 18795 TaxID=1227498 RepID=L9X7P1_9EURY|nr:hypothetical protein [Natronococcus jeotgali]ELY57784.1 hypothetical protein C492_12719 [Natronococcus jeotgali DSM 18795]
MSEELPVKITDLLALTVVSVIGGTLIASWTLSPRLTPRFAVSILSGTVLLLFFLFIPVMGARLFLDDRTDGE